MPVTSRVNRREGGEKRPEPVLAVAGRIPPQNLDAEVATLGGLLLDPDAMLKVVDILSAEDFYRPDYGTIYTAMLVLAEKRVPIDILTVADELLRVKKLEEVGGQAALSTLVSMVATASNVQHYAQIVREKAMLRRLISAAAKIGDLGFQENLASDVVLDQAEQTLFNVTQRFLKQNFVPVRSILTESFERLDALSKQDGLLRGVPTGFKHLDSILGGLQQADLIVLAARPSMGKTAMALNIAEHVAVREKKTVGIFSLEMSKEQLVDRLISSLGKIDSWKLRNGKLNDEDFHNLNEAYGVLAEANLFIDDAASANVMELRAKTRRLQAEHGLDLVIIDYLQLLEGTNYRGSDNRVQEVSEISRSLKALAKEINCPVLALSQLSREVEKRPDKRPLLSDLRESGCLAGESLITRADTGERLPIRELVGKTNIPIWSLDSNFRLVRQTISKVFSSGYKQTYELKLRSGRSIKASANHKFRIYEGWRRLDELMAGQRLATPREYNLQLPDNPAYSDELLISLAHRVGERLRPAHSGEKQLPESIFTCSNIQLSFFLHHLWATAGCLSSYRNKFIATYHLTTSDVLAYQLQSILLRLGIQSQVYKIKQKKENRICWASYKVEIQEKANQEQFLSLIGNLGIGWSDRLVRSGLIDAEREKTGPSWKELRYEAGMGSRATPLMPAPSQKALPKVAAALNSEILYDFATSEVYWDEIVSILPLGVEEVFDATVLGTHNFIANDIVSHNSIEQDSDVVIFLYREDYYNKDTQTNIMEILVRKHRNGPTGDAKVLARLQFSRFETLDTQHLGS